MHQGGGTAEIVASMAPPAPSSTWPAEVDGGALRLVVEERGDEPIPELVAILAGVLLCSTQVGAGAMSSRRISSRSL